MRFARPILAAVVSIFASSLLQAAPPTDEEIAKAVRDLSDRRFTVREKAAKLLWEAGKKAEPALQKALTSDDAETVRRAKQILERFAWGIYPDTPKEIVDLIARFRDGNDSVRADVIAKLIPLGRPGFSTIQRIIEHAPSDAQRKSYRSMLAANASAGVPRLILSGDNALVEELLELCIDEETLEGATNFAAFHHLTGSLDKAIDRWEKLFGGKKENVRAGTVLVHLCRAKGDFNKAAEVAAKIENKRLTEDLLWEQGKWRELAQFHEKSNVADRSGRALGARAMYHRAAGDPAGQEKVLAELKKATDTTDAFQFFAAIEGLLLNGRSNEAIQLMADRKIRVPVAFELMVAQLKVRDALALANESKDQLPQEQFELDLARARTLHLMGDKEQALQLLTRLGNRAPQSAELPEVHRLVKLMKRLHLDELALDTAANFMAIYEKQQQTESWADLLGYLFADQGDTADTWWRFLRDKNPKEDAPATLKKVQALMQGKPVPERDAWVKELTKVEGSSVPSTDSATRLSLSIERKHLAAAAALLAVNDDRQAEEHFKKACEDVLAKTAHLRYGDFLAEKKRWLEAASRYDDAARRSPSMPIAYFLYGWTLQQAGQSDAGRKAMSRAHTLPLGHEQTRLEFANQLSKRGFEVDARHELELVRQVGWYRDWYVGNVFNHLARDEFKARRFETAASLFEKSLIGYLRNDLVTFIDSSAYIQVPQTVVQLRARAALAAGKIDDGLKLLNESLDVLPGDIELVIQSLPELEKAGRKKDADELFRRVYQRYRELTGDYPNSSFAHNSAAWLAANCRRNLDEALKHAENAVRLEPKNAGYLDTLAEVHFRRGSQEKAVELMTRCISMEPKRPYFRKQLERYKKGDMNAPVPDSQEEE